MPPTRHATHAPWEAEYGYSRAVRSGPFVAVAGTTAVGDGGETLSPGDAGAQARAALRRVVAALAAVGASPADVVRTRLYVVDLARDGDAVGRAHAEVFGAVRPASTLVEVRALVRPDLLVEVEADAVVGAPEPAA